MDQTPPLLLGLAGYMLLRRHGPNPWIGVRLPWTFTDREIWDKSWLLAVVMLVAMGLGALFSWTLFVVSIIALIALGFSTLASFTAVNTAPGATGRTLVGWITARQPCVCTAGISRNSRTPVNWPGRTAKAAALAWRAEPLLIVGRGK